MVLSRPPKLCNFIEWKEMKIIYKRYFSCLLISFFEKQLLISSAQYRYASLYFIMCVDSTDNELIVLETIHHFVEVLDRYFGNVCELDLIFNFHKVRVRLLISHLNTYLNRSFFIGQAYFILDEMMMAGELQETSKKNVLRILAQQDIMHETTGQDASKFEL